MKPTVGGKENKGSFSLISIPIVLIVLSALIAFFIIRRSRSKDDSLETPSEKHENSNKNSGNGQNLLDEEIKVQNTSYSNSELDPSKEKFRQLKDRFNKPEPSKPATSSQTKTPGKVNQSLINNIQSVGAFRCKTEEGQESFTKNPPPQLQSKPEISETKDTKSRKDDNIATQERQTDLPEVKIVKEKENSKSLQQSKSGLSEANKDEKTEKVNNTTKLNSSATKELKQTSSPKEMTKVKHQAKIEDHPKKDQLSPADLQADLESKQNNLQRDQNYPQLLGGLTKTRTRGRAGRQPPTRTGRKNALKDDNFSSYPMH